MSVGREVSWGGDTEELLIGTMLSAESKLGLVKIEMVVEDVYKAVFKTL